jgi:hypothetical protein
MRLRSASSVCREGQTGSRVRAHEQVEADQRGVAEYRLQGKLPAEVKGKRPTPRSSRTIACALPFPAAVELGASPPTPLRPLFGADLKTLAACATSGARQGPTCPWPRATHELQTAGHPWRPAASTVQQQRGATLPMPRNKVTASLLPCFLASLLPCFAAGASSAFAWVYCVPSNNWRSTFQSGP